MHTYKKGDVDKMTTQYLQKINELRGLAKDEKDDLDIIESCMNNFSYLILAVNKKENRVATAKAQGLEGADYARFFQDLDFLVETSLNSAYISIKVINRLTKIYSLNEIFVDDFDTIVDIALQVTNEVVKNRKQ